MENQNYYVYIHTNKINGKKYVGITCREPEIRWNNGYGYLRNKHFFAAIKKYGWDSFTHEIVDVGLTSEEASEKEKELITKYKTTVADFGYNICSGGETNILPKESLEKIAGSKRGKPITEAMRKGRELNPPKARRVICDGQVFRSATECAKFYNISAKVLRKWIEGSNYIPKEFVDKELHYVDEEVVYQSYEARQKVLCENLEFSSIAQCAKYYDVNVNTMKNWLYGFTKTPQDFISKNLRREDNIRYKIKLKNF